MNVSTLTQRRTEESAARPCADLVAQALVFDRARVCLAFVAVLAIALARAPWTQVPSALFVSDGFGYYIFLPSLVIDGDLDFSNQITRIPYEGTKRFFQVSEETGRPTNQFPVGSAIMWSPFFLAADGVIQGLGKCGLPVDRSGFGYAYELPVYVGSFAYGLVGLWLMQRTLRAHFQREVADLTLFAIVFATPVVYYVWFEPNMSHSVALFLVAAWMNRLAAIYRTADERLWAWLLLGIILGLVALVRPYNGILGLSAIPVALAVFRRRGRAGQAAAIRRAGGRLVACASVALVLLTPQLLVWKTLYGSWFVIPRGSGYDESPLFDWRIPAFVVSIFAFFPVLVPAVAGLFCWRQTRAADTADDHPLARAPGYSAVPDVGPSRTFAMLVAPTLLLILVTIVVLVGGSRDWMLGTAFGQRRFVDWAPCLTLGLGLSFSAASGPRGMGVVSVLVVGLAGVNALLIVLYLSGAMPQYGRLL